MTRQSCEFKEKVVRDLYWILTSPNLIRVDIDQCPPFEAHELLGSSCDNLQSSQDGEYTDLRSFLTTCRTLEDSLSILRGLDDDPGEMFEFLRSGEESSNTWKGNCRASHTLGHYFACLIEFWLVHLPLVSDVIRGKQVLIQENGKNLKTEGQLKYLVLFDEKEGEKPPPYWHGRKMQPNCTTEELPVHSRHCRVMHVEANIKFFVKTNAGIGGAFMSENIGHRVLETRRKLQLVRRVDPLSENTRLESRYLLRGFIFYDLDDEKWCSEGHKGGEEEGGEEEGGEEEEKCCEIPFDTDFFVVDLRRSRCKKFYSKEELMDKNDSQQIPNYLLEAAKFLNPKHLYGFFTRDVLALDGYLDVFNGPVPVHPEERRFVCLPKLWWLSSLSGGGNFFSPSPNPEFVDKYYRPFFGSNLDLDLQFDSIPDLHRYTQEFFRQNRGTPIFVAVIRVSVEKKDVEIVEEVIRGFILPPWWNPGEKATSKISEPSWHLKRDLHKLSDNPSPAEVCNRTLQCINCESSSCNYSRRAYASLDNFLAKQAKKDMPPCLRPISLQWIFDILHHDFCNFNCKVVSKILKVLLPYSDIKNLLVTEEGEEEEEEGDVWRISTRPDLIKFLLNLIERRSDVLFLFMEFKLPIGKDYIVTAMQQLSIDSRNKKIVYEISRFYEDLFLTEEEEEGEGGVLWHKKWLDLFPRCGAEIFEGNNNCRGRNLRFLELKNIPIIDVTSKEDISDLHLFCVGLDCEWSPGKNNGVSLVQVASQFAVYLIDFIVLGMEKGMRIVETIFRSVELVIVFGMEDIRRLKLNDSENYPNLSTPIDLSRHDVVSKFCAGGCPSASYVSLRKSNSLDELTRNIFYGYCLDKSLQCSDWGNLARPLSEKYRIYAALDAYVVLAIFQALQAEHNVRMFIEHFLRPSNTSSHGASASSIKERWKSTEVVGKVDDDNDDGGINCKSIGFVHSSRDDSFAICVLPADQCVKEEFVSKNQLILASPIEAAGKFGFPLFGMGPFPFFTQQCGSFSQKKALNRQYCMIYIDKSLSGQSLIVGGGHQLKDVVVHTDIFLPFLTDKFCQESNNETSDKKTFYVCFADLISSN